MKKSISQGPGRDINQEIALVKEVPQTE